MEMDPLNKRLCQISSDISNAFLDEFVKQSKNLPDVDESAELDVAIFFNGISMTLGKYLESQPYPNSIQLFDYFWNAINETIKRDLENANKQRRYLSYVEDDSEGS